MTMMTSTLFAFAMLAGSAWAETVDNSTIVGNSTADNSTAVEYVKPSIKTDGGDIVIKAGTNKGIFFDLGQEYSDPVELSSLLIRISDLEDALAVVDGDHEITKSKLQVTSDDLASTKTALGKTLNAMQKEADDLEQTTTDATKRLDGYFNALQVTTQNCVKTGAAIKAISKVGTVQCSVKISSTSEIAASALSVTTSFMAGYNFYKDKNLRIAMDQILYPTYTKFISVMEFMIDADESNDNLYFDQSYYCVRQRDADPEAFVTWSLPQGTAMTKMVLWDRNTNNNEHMDVYWSSDYSRMKSSGNFRTNYVKIGNDVRYNKEFSFSSQPVNQVRSQYVADLHMDTSGNTDCFAGAHVTFKRVSFPGL
eukprot:m.138638 g.138638  ORF g.138638 m.138638 type:complete len:367 (+) comp30007_c0_seq1:247-1347(+)